MMFSVGVSQGLPICQFSIFKKERETQIASSAFETQMTLFLNKKNVEHSRYQSPGP